MWNLIIKGDLYINRYILKNSQNFCMANYESNSANIDESDNSANIDDDNRNYSPGGSNEQTESSENGGDSSSSGEKREQDLQDGGSSEG